MGGGPEWTPLPVPGPSPETRPLLSPDRPSETPTVTPSTPTPSDSGPVSGHGWDPVSFVVSQGPRRGPLGGSVSDDKGLVVDPLSTPEPEVTKSQDEGDEDGLQNP